MKSERIHVEIPLPDAPATARLERFSRLERDISTLFDRLFAPAHPFKPAAEGWWHPFTDIYENDTQFVIHMELAGVEPRSLEVIKEGRCLIVRGARHDPFASSRMACHQLEISFGAFERVICLPLDFVADSVKADYGAVTGFFRITVDKEIA
jgi:HSP20 family molecular chaperone IbpA